ncbi:hypothetical protein KCP75_06755 [Salmonella enterica subsp. enterica]|nr:hypothetical protein KCP75_06755 [Salmonella enterica subsp. enterica]
MAGGWRGKTHAIVGTLKRSLTFGQPGVISFRCVQRGWLCCWACARTPQNRTEGICVA